MCNVQTNAQLIDSLLRQIEVRNACYHSVQNILSSILSSKQFKDKGIEKYNFALFCTGAADIEGGT
jgi:uncharacterized membrane protein